MTAPQFFYDSSGAPLALHLPGTYKATGVEFLTNNDVNLQIGVMQRGKSTPVLPHFHNPIKRHVVGTQEVLFVQEGFMHVSLFDHNEELIHEVKVIAGDLILLISGGHSIEFSDLCRLIEVKQGPYSEEQDKRPLSENGSK